MSTNIINLDKIENLPPVHKFWSETDLNGLSRDDLMHLQLLLRSKMEVVSDRFERELYRKDRERWFQYKMLSYREISKRDYPFATI
jgi:hypothetical protein